MFAGIDIMDISLGLEESQSQMVDKWRARLERGVSGDECD